MFIDIFRDLGKVLAEFDTPVPVLPPGPKISRETLLKSAALVVCGTVLAACSPQEKARIKKELAGGYYIGQEAAKNQGNVAQEPPPVVPTSTDVPPEVSTAVPDKPTAQPAVNKKESRRETAQVQTAIAKEVDKRMAVLATKPNISPVALNLIRAGIGAGALVSTGVVGLWIYSIQDVKPLVAQEKEQRPGYYPNVDTNSNDRQTGDADIKVQWTQMQMSETFWDNGKLVCLNRDLGPIYNTKGDLVGYGGEEWKEIADMLEPVGHNRNEDPGTRGQQTLDNWKADIEAMQNAGKSTPTTGDKPIPVKKGDLFNP